MFIFRRTIILAHHLVSPLSVGDSSVHRLREFSRNLCTEQSPKESDDTRCRTNTIVLPRHSLWVTVQYTCYESPLVSCVLNSHPKIVTIPDAALIQLPS